MVQRMGTTFLDSAVFRLRNLFLERKEAPFKLAECVTRKSCFKYDTFAKLATDAVLLQSSRLDIKIENGGCITVLRTAFIVRRSRVPFLMDLVI